MGTLPWAFYLATASFILDRLVVLSSADIVIYYWVFIATLLLSDECEWQKPFIEFSRLKHINIAVMKTGMIRQSAGNCEWSACRIREKRHTITSQLVPSDQLHCLFWIQPSDMCSTNHSSSMTIHILHLVQSETSFGFEESLSFRWTWSDGYLEWMSVPYEALSEVVSGQGNICLSVSTAILSLSLSPLCHSTMLNLRVRLGCIRYGLYIKRPEDLSNRHSKRPFCKMKTRADSSTMSEASVAFS